MKRLVALILSLMVVLAFSGCKKEVSDQGDIPENIHAPEETLLAHNTPNAGKEFKVENTEGGVKIVEYSGSGINVIIPEEIDGKAVVEIGDNVFANKAEVEQVYVGAHITKIAPTAFENSPKLVIVTTAGSTAHNFAAEYQVQYNLY